MCVHYAAVCAAAPAPLAPLAPLNIGPNTGGDKLAAIAAAAAHAASMVPSNIAPTDVSDHWVWCVLCFIPQHGTHGWGFVQVSGTFMCCMHACGKLAAIAAAAAHAASRGTRIQHAHRRESGWWQGCVRVRVCVFHRHSCYLCVWGLTRAVTSWPPLLPLLHTLLAWCRPTPHPLMEFMFLS